MAPYPGALSLHFRQSAPRKPPYSGAWPLNFKGCCPGSHPKLVRAKSSEACRVGTRRDRTQYYDGCIRLATVRSFILMSLCAHTNYVSDPAYTPQPSLCLGAISPQFVPPDTSRSGTATRAKG